MAKIPVKVIQYDGGDNRVLVHRTEITDFSVENVLVVDASQQALLYKDGIVQGPFAAGRHALPSKESTGFFAFFKKLFSRHKQGLPLTCDVYFINTVNDVPVQWGTPSRTPVLDPVYKEMAEVGANGSLKVKITNPERFVLTVNGRLGGYSIERIQNSVRSEVLAVIKTYIAQMIIEGGVSLLEIQTKLLSLSQLVEEKLNERLADYGLTAVHFIIEDISINEETKKRFLARQSKINARTDVVLDSQAQTDADYMRTVRMAEAHAREREMQGYSYQDEKYWEVQKIAAEHAAPQPPYNPYGAPPYGGYPPVYPAPYGVPPYNQPYGQPPYGAPCNPYGVPPQQPPQAQTAQTHTYKTDAEPRKCPRCGYPLLPRMSSCPACGYDLEGENEDK